MTRTTSGVMNRLKKEVLRNKRVLKNAADRDVNDFAFITRAWAGDAAFRDVGSATKGVRYVVLENFI